MKAFLPYLPFLAPIALVALCHAIVHLLLLVKRPREAAFVARNTATVTSLLPAALDQFAVPSVVVLARDLETAARANPENALLTVLSARAKAIAGTVTVAALALLAAGCAASPLKTAIVVSNGLADVGQAASTTLESTCTAAYKTAKTEADLAAIDKPCLPAAKAYAVLRATHAALVAAIVAVEAGADPAQLDAAIQRARDAASTLGAVISEVAK